MQTKIQSPEKTNQTFFYIALRRQSKTTCLSSFVFMRENINWRFVTLMTIKTATIHIVELYNDVSFFHCKKQKKILKNNCTVQNNNLNVYLNCTVFQQE